MKILISEEQLKRIISEQTSTVVVNGSELNVLNKDAIESFKPIYKLDTKTSKWNKL
jgi:hypothetical protein